MRVLILAITALLAAGCGEQQGAVYEPTTFREDVQALVHEERYGHAIDLLDRVDLQAQLAHDRHGYMLIAEDLIYRPGVPDEHSFPQDGDWELPGTSDAVINSRWQEAATKFAREYNLARWALDHP